MASLDWLVITIYLLGLLMLAWYLGKGQSDNSEYYLGGGNIPPWALATSVIATQCSTNSLLGAPAFVGFSEGGGMRWLQYEMALPLAMLFLGFLFVQIKNKHHISIYAFLEDRLGVECRLLASGSFLFFRGIATGVTVYGVASVLQLVTELSYLEAVIALMALTIIYDVSGGIKAVVYSDVIQMVLLVAAIAIALIMLWGGISEQTHLMHERSTILDSGWGFSGDQYGLWPMLFGGLFLYMAYYGCDQSQAQRILAAKDRKSALHVLWLNGLFRFPLVLLYCLLGLGLAAYSVSDPDFIQGLPLTANGQPNINLAFPFYVLKNFPAGLVGLIIVGIFAAAMSSIDSALNSLSASTIDDFILRFKPIPERSQLLLSKLVTLFWGIFAIVFSYQVENIAATILEAINKIGSLINGPVLSLFIIAVFFQHVGARIAIFGFCMGLGLNLVLWLGFPNISWLWWNLFGCLTSLAAVFCCKAFSIPITLPKISDVGRNYVASLLIYFAAILTICAAIPTFI